MQINLGSAFRCTRLAVPLLRETKALDRQHLVHRWHLRLSVAVAVRGGEVGVIGLTKTWAMELGAGRHPVNAICPGSVGGPRMDGVIEREAAPVASNPAEIRHAYEQQVSMRSFIDASDIGETIVFLASPAARFISGQVLSVDGHTETLSTR